MNISENIKKLRTNKGITQEQLSKLAKISRISIGNYERGDRTPGIETIKSIATALGVTVSDLIETRGNSFSMDLISAIEKAWNEKNNGYSTHNIFQCFYDDLGLDVEIFDNFRAKILVMDTDSNGEHTFEEIGNKEFDSSHELSIDIQLKLLDYLAKTHYQTFLDFIEADKGSIYPQEVKKKIDEIMFSKLSEIETTSLLAFKKYLYMTLKDKMKNITNDDLMIIEEGTKEFIEFAIHKLNKQRKEGE